MIKGYNPFKFLLMPYSKPQITEKSANRPMVGQFLSYLDWLAKAGLNEAWFEKYSKHYDKNYVARSTNLLIKAFNDKTVRKMAGFWAHCWFALVLSRLGRTDDFDKGYLIDYIQSKQIHDGGFLSDQASLDPTHRNYKGTFSDMKNTWYAVRALTALGAKPLDTKAVQEFVYGLKDENKNRWGQRYPTEFSRGDPIGGGFHAFLILSTLGIKEPFFESFFNKEKYDDFLINYEKMDQKEIYNQLRGISYSTQFSQEYGEKYRIAARKIAHYYYQNRLADAAYLEASNRERGDNFYLMSYIYRLGLGKPNADFYLKYDSYDLTQTENKFELVLHNFTPLQYDIKLKSVDIISKEKNVFTSTDIKKNKLMIKPEDTVKTTINLEQPDESTKLLKKVKDIKIKFVLEAPIPDLYQYMRDNLVYECEVYFDLPIKSK
jgi:hypothetical protein